MCVVNCCHYLKLCPVHVDHAFKESESDMRCLRTYVEPTSGLVELGPDRIAHNVVDLEDQSEVIADHEISYQNQSENVAQRQVECWKNDPTSDPAKLSQNERCPVPVAWGIDSVQVTLANRPSLVCWH